METTRAATKIFALVVACAMAMCLCVAPAFAASITINSKSTGDQADTTKYVAYEIFKADIKTGAAVNESTGATTTAGVAAYYIPAANSDLATLINATSVFKTTLSADGSRYIVELENASATADQIATALNTAEIKAKALSTNNFAQTTAGGTATSGTVDPGYYLVTSSLGTKLAVQTLSDVTIDEKNTYPSVTKTVNEGSDSAQIGDDVTYTITVTLPASADKGVVVTDTLSAGLTYKSCTVNDGVTGTVEHVGGSQVTTITFTPGVVAANAGSNVTITFVATVNTNAVVQQANQNTNAVDLKYNNEYTTKTTTVDTETQKITLTKYDGSDPAKTPIAGAVFELRDAGGKAVSMTAKNGSTTDYTVDPGGTVTQITTVAGTVITVEGLDADVTYTWVEITPPTGYNGLSEGTTVKPTTDAVANSEIANNQGTTLPSTGGMGTTLLYIVGSVLAIGAVIGLVVRRRMSVQE